MVSELLTECADTGQHPPLLTWYRSFLLGNLPMMTLFTLWMVQVPSLKVMEYPALLMHPIDTNVCVMSGVCKTSQRRIFV